MMMLKTMALISRLHALPVSLTQLAEVKLHWSLHIWVALIGQTTETGMETISEVGVEGTRAEVEEIGVEAEEGFTIAEVTVVVIHYHHRITRMVITHNHRQPSHSRLCPVLLQDTHCRKALHPTSTMHLLTSTHLSNLYYGNICHIKPNTSDHINKLSQTCRKVAGKICPKVPLYPLGLS